MLATAELGGDFMGYMVLTRKDAMCYDALTVARKHFELERVRGETVALLSIGSMRGAQILAMLEACLDAVRVDRPSECADVGRSEHEDGVDPSADGNGGSL